MSIRLVGAGRGRTGTTSLKLALGQLLCGPFYHMLEVRKRPDPICDMLGLDVPDEPFPHASTTAEFGAELGLDR